MKKNMFSPSWWQFLKCGASALAFTTAFTCRGLERLDLSGEWSVSGEGWECLQTAQHLGSEWMIPPGTPPDYSISGKARLPGTLADSGLGVEQTYEKWSSFVGVQSRQTLCLCRKFLGRAVYTRRVEVPESMNGKALELFMERVMWKSSLKVDGRAVGEADSLGTPHVYRFAPGELSPGTHLLEIEIDNTCRYEFSGWSHGWGPPTQTQWNGVIGEFSIRETNPLREVRVFAGWPANGRVVLKLPPRAPLDAVEIDGLAVTGFRRDGDEATVSFEGEPEYWSEFHPRLYTLRMRGGGFSLSRRIAFRTVSAKGHRLYMNGKPFWFRGNVDNCQFPHTGYPAMTKAEWRRQIKIQQLNGCNGMRTHTWTPPEAAFAVADELGFYLLVETCYWSDGNIMKRAVGRGNAALDEFCHAELKRVQDTYGDHPSLVSLGLGNELGACDLDVLEKWMSEAKARDGRYLSIASTARKVCPSDDYMTTHDYPGIGATRHRRSDNTDWDYEDVYSRAPIPVLAHEIGQWPVYPIWNDIGKFDGLLRPYDWMEMRDAAISNDTFRFQRQWHASSMKTNRLKYKDEVESFMRTPSCAGLQLLDVRDYTGQGEALVGWLDAFFDAKPGCSGLPAFSDVFRPVPFLARFCKYVWRVGETFTARLQIRNMTEDDIPAGSLYPVSFAGRRGMVRLARALAAGGRVVYIGKSALTGHGWFGPVYWSTKFTKRVGRHVMSGTWFDEDHPAFGEFFTEDWMDWQWRDLTDRSIVHVLTGLVPRGFTPIAMPISDLHNSELLGTMFEFSVGRGRALVCGYPICDASLPEALQLRKSIFGYVAGDAFRPPVELSPAMFADMFSEPGETAAAERERYLTPFADAE